MAKHLSRWRMDLDHLKRLKSGEVCCMKLPGATGELGDYKFGVVYGHNPLVIHLRDDTGNMAWPPQKITFPNLEDMLNAGWMVD